MVFLRVFTLLISEGKKVIGMKGKMKKSKYTEIKFVSTY